MASPELLQLVENCPTGAETLIARILNIITDKGSIINFHFEVKFPIRNIWYSREKICLTVMRKYGKCSFTKIKTNPLQNTKRFHLGTVEFRITARLQ